MSTSKVRASIWRALEHAAPIATPVAHVTLGRVDGPTSSAPEQVLYRGLALTWIKDAGRSRCQFADEPRQGARLRLA
jgi:hypothetical protein